MLRWPTRRDLSFFLLKFTVWSFLRFFFSQKRFEKVPKFGLKEFENRSKMPRLVLHTLTVSAILNRSSPTFNSFLCIKLRNATFRTRNYPKFHLFFCEKTNEPRCEFFPVRTGKDNVQITFFLFETKGKFVYGVQCTGFQTWLKVFLFVQHFEYDR